MAVRVLVDDRDVVVEITGWDALWALSRGLRVPFAQIRDVAAVRRADLGRRPVLRMGGTAFPGKVKAGRYLWRGWSEFWATRWPDRILVITCTDDGPYDRIVLEVDDPGVDAGRILAALR